MKRLLALIFIVSVSLLCTLFAISPDELPFGAEKLYNYTDAEAQKLAEEMCFNIFMQYDSSMTSTGIGYLYDHGIVGVRGGIIRWTNDGEAEAPVKYSFSCYGEVDVAFPYPNEEVRMVAFGGYYDSTDGDMWISPTGSIDTLSGLNTRINRFQQDTLNLIHKEFAKNFVRFPHQYPAGFPGTGRIQYRIDTYMMIDELGDSTDTVAYVYCELGIWETVEPHIEHIDTIYASEFNSVDSIHIINSYFSFPDSINIDDSTVCVDSIKYKYVTLNIETTDSFEVAIDKILISDEFGRELLEGDYDDDIFKKFNEYASDSLKLFGWFLKDEPAWVNFRPFGYIHNLMDSVYSSWMPMTFFNNYQTLTHTYLDLVNVDFTLNDIYPFGNGDVYAGEDFQANWNGPLYCLNKHLSWCRVRVDRDSAELWHTPQAFDGKHWRRPTPSEFSCQTFMGLTWGARGIIYWYYDRFNQTYTGIRDFNGVETFLYDKIKNDIGPYIQAFDEYYMPLVWDTTYTYKAGLYSPPTGALIDTISTYTHPDSVEMNPDSGWFHVGEFHDDGDTLYFMLVNRSCSMGPDDPTEAPSITAFVRFDPSAIGSDYAYIIDIAKEVKLDSSETDTIWIGIPDTTYSAKLDGTIPFTTVLKAGEGRLYKIVGTK